MKKITLLILPAIILLCGNAKLFAQPTYSNTITLTSGNSIPLGGNVTTGQCMQNIFLPGEFTGGPFNGLITTIYYRSSTSITTATTATYTNFTVKMGQTAATTLTAGTWVTAGMAQVYLNPSLTLTWPISTGPNPWIQIILQTPFLYDPSQSLVVEVGHAGIVPTTSFFPIMNGSLSGVRRVWANVPNNPVPITFAGSGADCPNFGFDEVPNGPCIDPPTAGTGTATPATVCSGGLVSLNTTGGTFGTGQTYQWKSSPVINGAYTTNVGGVLTTTASLGINPVATLYYKCFVTCGANTDSSSAVLVTVNPSLPGGTYTINNTLATGGSNFNSFTAAVNAMACGIGGPVIFNVSAGQTFTENVPVISVNSTAVNTLRFQRSGPGANPVIRPTGGAATTDAGIALIGTDFATFDGIDISIASGTLVEFGYYIANNGGANGSQNDSVKNCTISLSRTVTTTRGIFQNVVTAPSSAAGANSNNVYMNLTIKNVYGGIHLTGNTTFPDLNTQITTSGCGVYNIIGDPAVPFDIGGGNTATQNFGIRATFQAGFTIINNKITNVSSTTTTDGIFIETFFGATGNLISTLANNIVRAVRINSTTASTQVNGIRITNSTATPPAGTILRVYNNAVSDITSAYSTATGVAWASTTGIKGMNMASTSALTQYTYEIYNNSVSIDGSGSPFLHSTAFQRSVTTSANTNNIIRNNMWANHTGAQVTPAGHYAFANGLAGTATALGVSGVSFVSNNNLYIANATQGFAARGATTDYATVATWQTAYAQATVNQSINPIFLNNSTDLHVNNPALDALGATYPAYLTQDLDCATRTGTADIGAYLIVPCTGTPTAGTPSATPSSVCPGASSNLTSVGFSTGVTFQWVSSAVSGGPYTAIGGAISFNYNTGPVLANTYFKLVVTCTSSSLSDSSAQVAVNVIAAPTVSVTPAGPLSACAGNVVQLTSTNNAVTPSYQWKRNGTDIAGATLSTFTPVQTGTYTLSVIDNAAPASCPGLSNAVVDTVYPLPPTAATATPSSFCSGDSSQLNANVFVGGVLTSPITGATNGSAATGFDITNISTGPITLHYFSFQSNATLGTIANQSVYVRFSPMNCVLPTNVTTDPTYVLIGTVPTTSNGPIPAAPTVIPLDVNITIPAGATYAFAVGGASQQYWNGTSGCPVMGTTPHLQVKEGWGGTFTGIIAGRQWHGTVTYDYGDPNATVVWSPATGLSSTTAVNPKSNPPVGTTTYTVTVTGTGGCTSTSSVSVTNLGVPDPAPTTTSDTTCLGDTAHLLASGVSTLRWFTAATGGTLKHIGSSWDSAWAATTTYWVESFNGNCPSSRVAVTATVLPLPPISATAVPAVLCNGESSQLTANVFISGTLTSPATGATNGSAATGFDITNISSGPITLHYFSYQSSAVLGTVANQSVYKRLTPMNCVFPTNITTDPNYILVGTVATTSNGPVPAAPTVIPLDVNVTIPPGATYSFAIGGAAQQYWNGTTGCPIMGSTPHLQVREGWGGTFTGIIGNRQWHGSVTYSYGDPNALVSWSPATGLSSTTAVNPIATPPLGTTVYTVTVTGTGGCTNSATASVTVNAVPPVPTIDSVANVFCGCGSATLYAHINGSGTSIRWYDTPTGGTLLGTGSPFNTPVFCGPKTFYAEEFDPGTGCPSSSRMSFLITPTTAIAINAGSDAVLCDGAGPAALTVTSANPGYAYGWSPVLGLNTTTGASVNSNPGVNTTYIVTGTDGGSGCVNKDTVTVFVGLTPIIGSISSTPSSLCLGDTAYLSTTASIPGGNVIDFTPPYAPPTWTTQHTAGDLGVVNSFTTTSLSMTSSDAGVGTTDIDVIHTVTATGNITFNWSYSTVDDAEFDYPMYYKNGVRTMLPGYNITLLTTPQSGSASIPVTAGDVFGFTMESFDNGFGGATTTFTNVVFPGATAVLTYSWSPSGSLNNSTITNPKAVPPVGTTTYTVTVSNNGCTATSSIPVTVNLTPPPPVVIGDTVCGPDTVHVSAVPSSGSNTIFWTDTIGGQIIQSGNAYSRYVTNSGSFYVTEVAGTGNSYVGYSGVDLASGFFPDIASYMNFTVINSEGLIINTVQVSTNLGAGSWPLVVALVNTSGQIVSVHDTIYITGGNTALQTISLNMFVPQGSWRLQPIFNPNLSVHQLASVTASFPWTIPGLINITCFGNASSSCFSTSPTGTFGLFYNWNVSTVCNSLQSIVNYVVNPSSPIGIATSAGSAFCDIASTTLTAVDSAGSVYESYAWSPATGLSATTGSSVTVSGLTQTTTYTLIATDVDAGCHALTTKTITIQPKPTLLLSFHDTTICRTEPSLVLSATAAKSSIVQLGTREDPNFVSGYVYGGNTTQKSQMIFTKSELNAAGLFGPTSITSLAFFVSGKLTTTTYTVSIDMRSDAALIDSFPNINHKDSLLTNVYTNGAVSSTLGWNTYVFTTPFFWNGNSNVEVSTCFTHNVPGFFDIVYTSAVGHPRFNALNATACAAVSGALLNDRPNVRFTGGTVFYNWTPAAGLSSPSVEDPVMTPNFAGVDTALYYVLTVTDPLSGCTATDSVHVNVSSTPPIPHIVFIGDSVICFSGAPSMRAFGTSGSFQWQNSSNGINFNNIPGANNDTLNAAVITTSTYYRFYSSCGDTSYSNVLFVQVNNPQVVSTTGDTVCGFGTVCLSAVKNQPNYNVSWYNVPTGGVALATGDTFCTNISATTTYYASVSTPGGPPVTNSYFNYTTTLGSNSFPFAQTAGKEVQWFVGPGEFVNPSAAPTGGLITSISFYAATTSAGATFSQFTVKLGQLAAPFAGGAFYSGPMTTVILPSTKTIAATIGTWFTLTLDVPFAYDPTQWLVVDVGQCGITAGTGFNVYQNTLTGVRRAWSVGGCPFAFTNNDATLPGITLGLTSGSQCNSTRVAVNAVSTPAPPLATVSHITTICEGSCATLAVDAAGQANYQTFSWSPATGLTSTTGASVQACPTSTTTYTVVGLDLIGGCQRTDTVRVEVNPAPVITISSTPPVICTGDSSQLSAGAATGPSGTLAMPPELSTFPGNVRGYSFTAPVSFTITGIQALGTTVGTQSVAIVKFVPAVPPPIFSLTTNAFTTLFLAQNVPTGNIPVSITVNAGDVIGILGCRTNVTSYANPAGPYATTIGGMPVTLTRMGMQFPLTTTAPQDLWTETAGSIGRVEFTYGTTGTTSYVWTPPTGLSASNISNPKASPASTTTYTVTVTNNTTGCTKTGSVTVNVTPQPIPYIYPNDSVLCTGQVINIVARDSGAYIGGWPIGTTFDFGFGPTTDSTFLVNGPGNYNVHVTLPPSQGSCNKTSFFANIDYRDAPVLIVSTDSVKCNGTATGSVSSQLFLGSPPYRFRYYNNLGNLVRDTIRNESYDTLYNVTAGNYCVIAFDTANAVYPPPSCASDSICVQVGEPPLLVASEIHTTIACNGNSSTVTISATGGTPPLTGTGIFTQFAGTQIYTVTDALGCTDTVVVIITQPPVLTVSTTVVNIPCTYVAANVNTIVAGGTPSYEYQWSNSAVTPNLSAVGAGTYTVTVTDINGCTATAVATVAPPGPIIVTSTPVMPVCRGAATGSISIGVTGGMSAYTYLWNGGNTNQNRSGLTAGTYTVTVTDINGCTKTKTTVITQPATTLVINSNQTNVRCFGLSSGVATAAPVGGSSPYSYSWNTVPVKTTASITGLTAGVYTCSVTDAIGCTKTLVITITQPTDITVFQTQSNVTFPGGNNGSATVSVSGGTPGYTYSWNTVPVKTTATVTGLTAGTYKCTITDTKSCTKKVTFIITEPISRPEGNSGNSEWNIRAYPNPTSGTIMISFASEDAERVNVTLTDYTGRLIYETTENTQSGENLFTYDLSHLSKGVYFMRLDAADRNKVIRIVIE